MCKVDTLYIESRILRKGRKHMGRFLDIARNIGTLTDEKNDAYGDSFVQSGRVMAILYPNGIAVDQMRDALGVVRVLDKLFRIANKKDAFGESPWRDISGYGLLGAVADCMSPPSLPRELRDTLAPTGDEGISLTPAVVNDSNTPDTLRSAPAVVGGVGFPDRFLRPEDIRPTVSEARYAVIQRDARGKIMNASKAADVVEADQQFRLYAALSFPQESVEIRDTSDKIVRLEYIQGVS